MRNARTIKSRIAAIDKRIGELPPLITLTIEKPDGSLEYRGLDPVDALIKIIDARAAEYFEESQEEAESSQLYQYKNLGGRIVGAEISGNYDEEKTINHAPLLAINAFRGLQREREEREKDALC